MERRATRNACSPSPFIEIEELDEPIRGVITNAGVQLVEHTVEVGYDHWTAGELTYFHCSPNTGSF